MLYARLGQAYCPNCDLPIGTQTADEIIDKVLSLPEGTKLYLMAPLERRGQESYETLFDEIRRGGFVRMRVDGKSYNVEDPPDIDHRRKHQVEAIVDRIIVRRDQRSRLADAVETALDLGRGVLHVAHVEDGKPEPAWHVKRFSQHIACDRCGRSFEPLNPHHFSFNSPLGWCPTCEGLGVQKGASPALLHPRRQPVAAATAPGCLADLKENPAFAAFAESLARHAGFSLDTPFERWSPRSSACCYTVPAMRGSPPEYSRRRRPLSSVPSSTRGFSPPSTRRPLSPVYRQRLDHLVNEVPAACGGSRLRADAAACRFSFGAGRPASGSGNCATGRWPRCWACLRTCS